MPIIRKHRIRARDPLGNISSPHTETPVAPGSHPLMLACKPLQAVLLEGLLSISDLPKRSAEEGEESLPPEDCDETTCF